MREQEAREVLATELERYRRQTYEQLQRLLTTQDDLEVRGASGTTFHVEIQAVWDTRRGGCLRVSGAIDDGKLLRALRPVCADFIVAPDGTFIGEDASSS